MKMSTNNNNVTPFGKSGQQQKETVVYYMEMCALIKSYKFFLH